MKHYPQDAAVYRLLIVPAPRLTADAQRERAKAVVPLGALVQEYGPDTLAEWYEMSRDADVLVVDQLELIPPVRRKGRGVPTAILGQVRGWLRAHKSQIMESSRKAEPDAKRWREAEANVARGHRILVTRRLPTETASELGKRRGEQARRESIVEYYRAHPERAIFVAIWRGAEGDAAAALAALNADLTRRHLPLLGSEASARRAFGDRGKRKSKP